MKEDRTPSDQADDQELDTVRLGRKYRVSADRTSATRKVRYQEGSQPDAGNCTICDLDS